MCGAARAAWFVALLGLSLSAGAERTRKLVAETGEEIQLHTVTAAKGTKSILEAVGSRMTTHTAEEHRAMASDHSAAAEGAATAAALAQAREDAAGGAERDSNWCLCDFSFVGEPLEYKGHRTWVSKRKQGYAQCTPYEGPLQCPPGCPDGEERECYGRQGETCLTRYSLEQGMGCMAMVEVENNPTCFPAGAVSGFTYDDAVWELQSPETRGLVNLVADYKSYLRVDGKLKKTCEGCVESTWNSIFGGCKM